MPTDNKLTNQDLRVFWEEFPRGEVYAYGDNAFIVFFNTGPFRDGVALSRNEAMDLLGMVNEWINTKQWAGHWRWERHRSDSLYNKIRMHNPFTYALMPKQEFRMVIIHHGNCRSLKSALAAFMDGDSGVVFHKED